MDVNILPYLEQEALWAVGKGQNDTDKRQSLVTTISAPLAVFNCPSRRPCEATPYSSVALHNADTPTVAARCDYAGNMGESLVMQCEYPHDYQEADTWGMSPLYAGILFIRSFCCGKVLWKA